MAPDKGSILTLVAQIPSNSVAVPRERIVIT
jgi:hypothetical protein